MLRIRNRFFLAFDVLVCLVTPTMALVLRQSVFDWSEPEVHGLIAYTAFSLLVKLPVFFRYGLYNRYWRYAGFEEVWAIVSATGVATTRLLILVVAERLMNVFTDVSVPLSLPFIDALLSVAIIVSVRFSEKASSLLSRRSQNGGGVQRKRVLIAGAGDAGSMILRELMGSDKLSSHPVAFVDDDPEKQGVRIGGVPVRGTMQDIPRLVKDSRIDHVIIAMPTAPGKVIRKIVTLCSVAGVPSKTVPGIFEILSGRVGVSQLRNVEIDDLLRREPVKTDMAAVTEFVRGRRVLVTGAGGSIGSELCRQVLSRAPASLVVLGHGENSVFEIMRELNELRATMALNSGSSAMEIGLHPVIADIRFPGRIAAVFKEFKPDVVFHAAAHKHVTLMEENPDECILNNVLGTRNLLNAAVESGVANFVLISTDKAVNPSSMMGVCKRVAEQLTHDAAKRSGRAFVAVRFGNVLGSRGSVVLSFRRQIASGGPITVTHADMERYFMLIPEAVQLVLQAAVLGQGGEVFMLDMGEPVRIVDMARDMVRLSGLELGRDIDIQYLGMRPGEKLKEELFGPGEDYHKTAHQKIFIAARASGGVADRLNERCDALIASAREGRVAEIYAGLQEVVPEFTRWTPENEGKPPGGP